MLALYPDQLDALARPDDFDTWCAARTVCIALSHHPPRWLARAGTKHLLERYFTGDRVALHLCGHVHEKTEAQYGEGWRPETRIFLGRSLFGVEQFAPASERTPPSPASSADEEDLSRSFGYALGQLRFTPGRPTAELIVYPRRAVVELGTMVIRADDGAHDFTKALDTKHVQVRALPASATVVPSRDPVMLAASPSIFRRPVFDEIVDELRSISPLRPGGVFLFAPTRHGAAVFVDFLEAEISERRAGSGEAGPVILARFDFQGHVGDRLDAKAIQKRLCQAIRDTAFPDPKSRQRVPTESLEECVQHVTLHTRERPLLILVLESFPALPDEDNRWMQARLRAAIDNNKYTPKKGGLRVLLVSRVESAQTFSENAPGSALTPALRSFALTPLSDKEAERCALRHPAWRPHADCVRWLWTHTGGHPEVYIRLCDAFARTEGAWPSFLQGPATDADRTEWLHGRACPLKREVDELAQTLAAVLAPFAKRLPAPLGTLGPDAPADTERAVEESGLFLTQAPPFTPIPFVARALARPARR
jgi:hypothetical protein